MKRLFVLFVTLVGIGVNVFAGDTCQVSGDEGATVVACSAQAELAVFEGS